MKKHIMIAGVPRAGKSTVSQMIAKQYGYQHISMDSIIAGIEKVFPETGIDTRLEDFEHTNTAYISSRIAPFIRTMMNSGEYDECGYGMVIDICQLMPEDFVKYIDSEICDVFYFLTSDVTPEERFAILKQYDRPKDYTYFSSDDENRKECDSIVKLSKVMREQCEEYQLPFYETSRDRERVLKEFMQMLLGHNR